MLESNGKNERRETGEVLVRIGKRVLRRISVDIHGKFLLSWWVGCSQCQQCQLSALVEDINAIQDDGWNNS